MKVIKVVGVVGAGTMGAALAQKFAQENFKVILADRDVQFVERGISNISKMLAEGIEKKVFTPEQVKLYLSNITGTADLEDLKSCDVIIEAIYENFGAKTELFRTLDGIVGNETILATNTSSFSVNDLAGSVSHPERFIGVHYFYHAAKNRLVEIIPGNKTSTDVFEAMKVFAVQSGKDAITCRDAYGFVVNRYFVPWLNEACRLLEDNWTNIATIDDVCAKTFGIGMGPFALMNATGVPVAYHAQKTLETFGDFYKVSDRLKQQTEAKQNWDLQGEVSADIAIRQKVAERMLGVVFLVCAQLLDEEVCTADAINRGARIGLQWKKGPVDLMIQYGETEVLKLVGKVAVIYSTEMPLAIGGGFWKMNFVELKKNGNVAVITMNRPEDMNALNEEVMRQLDEKFSAADSDPVIATIFITGTGKAFVAGADIRFFVKNIKANKIDLIESFTRYGQKVFQKIDESKKKVVAVLNGLTLGGGLELALCADVILTLPKTQMAFPETGIGIYPGLGGTQRSVRRIGKALSKYLIHTGKMLSATDAFEMGLTDGNITINEMLDLFSGAAEVPGRRAVELNEKWRNVQHFFEKNAVSEVLTHHFVTNGLKSEEAEKIFSNLKRKAPIALSIADKLIDESKGCESELTHLKEIFSTSDALLGLTSIGKQVEYQGR
jgi:enoyl-CoA hydratase/3-hydroxyacyl-CoA dehydrogenase